MISKECIKNLEDKNEKYIFKFNYLEDTYIQTIKLINKKIKYNYYKMINNEIQLVEDVNLLKEFSAEYEMLPNDINYKGQETNNKRQKNQNVKKWAIEFAINEFLNCNPVVKVYGKRFITRRIKKLDELYTNEKIDNTSGYQEDYEITLCHSGKDGMLLSIEEIKNNEKIRQTLIHEMVHLMLRRRIRFGKLRDGNENIL